MANLEYDLFNRVLVRSKEISTQTNAKSSVTRVYNEKLGPLADKFLSAHAAVDAALSAHLKEQTSALVALVALDQPYREARAVVVAFKPESVLPETLKTAPTDTDKMNAVEGLMKILDDNHNEPWAAELLAGEIGQKAPEALLHLHAEIDDNKILAKARTDRAAAYGPAYEAYLRYKNVVRTAFGATSKEYHRIHIRHSAKLVEDAADQAGGATAAASGAGASAAAATAVASTDKTGGH